MKTEKFMQEFEQDYDLEIPKIVEAIKKQNSKRVLIQLPDGLKLHATEIADALENELKKELKNKTEFLIWLDSCYGACDVPVAESEKLGIDLIVQFGHSKWKFSEDRKKEICVLK